MRECFCICILLFSSAGIQVGRRVGLTSKTCCLYNDLEPIFGPSDTRGAGPGRGIRPFSPDISGIRANSVG
jgi:hypothetical protein